jgi:hypothetical protein
MPEQAKLPEIFPPSSSNDAAPVAYYAPMAPPQELEAEAPSIFGFCAANSGKFWHSLQPACL